MNAQGTLSNFRQINKEQKNNADVKGDKFGILLKSSLQKIEPME